MYSCSCTWTARFTVLYPRRGNKSNSDSAELWKRYDEVGHHIILLPRCTENIVAPLFIKEILILSPLHVTRN